MSRTRRRFSPEQKVQIVRRHLAEREQHPVIFTLDGRDLSAVQKKWRRSLMLLSDGP